MIKSPLSEIFNWRFFLDCLNFSLIRAVSERDWRTEEKDSDSDLRTKILIDSGADAAIFPSRWSRGPGFCNANSTMLQLQDAQGNPIPTGGSRQVKVKLQTLEGQPVILKENVAFSDRVSQPILCFGKLLQRGWSISSQSKTLTNGKVNTPLKLENKSLVVRGGINLVQKISALKVELGSSLKDLRHGWILAENGNYVGFHVTPVDPTYVPGLEQMRFRTTLAQKEDNTWELVEMAQELLGMDDLRESLFEGDHTPRHTITILTKEYVSDYVTDFVVEMGEMNPSRKQMERIDYDPPYEPSYRAFNFSSRGAVGARGRVQALGGGIETSFLDQLISQQN